MSGSDTLLVECRELLQEDKLEKLFQVYGFSQPVRMDGFPLHESTSELQRLPSAPVFSVSLHWVAARFRAHSHFEIFRICMKFELF